MLDGQISTFGKDSNLSPSERYFSKILSTEDLDELSGAPSSMSRQKSLHHREIEGTFINYEK